MCVPEGRVASTQHRFIISYSHATQEMSVMEWVDCSMQMGISTADVGNEVYCFLAITFHPPLPCICRHVIKGELTAKDLDLDLEPQTTLFHFVIREKM